MNHETKFTTRIFLIILFQILFLNLTCAQEAYFKVENNFLKLGNSFLEFQFQNNDGKLYSFIDKNSKVDLIKEKSSSWTLYTYFFTRDNSTEYVGIGNSKSFKFKTTQTANGIILEMNWNGFQTDITHDISVTVTIEITDSPYTNWHIGIDNNSKINIEGISFPSFTGIGQISSNSANDYVVYPMFSGLLIQDPLNNFTVNRGWGWEQYYPSFSNMQFTAYYSKEKKSGIYIATEDSNCYRKFISWSKSEANWLAMSIFYTPLFSEGNDIDLPYQIKIGTFSGDWYEAAMIYRNWAITQPWTLKGKLIDRSDIPSWFKSLPLNVWILTHPWDYPSEIPFSTVAERSSNISSFLKVPVSMNWTGWENQGWYILHPDIFPPKEGWDSFDLTIEKLHKYKNNFTSIINSTSFSSFAPTFNEASGNFVLDRYGSYYKSYPSYNEGNLTASFYGMCPYTDYWKNRIKTFTDILKNHSVDVIEMDGFPPPIPICYNQKHGHPIGGGNWFIKEYYKIFNEIRLSSKSFNPELAFQTEGMSEPFIPLFDGFWNMCSTGISLYGNNSIDPLKSSFIPLWQAVYHDFIPLQSGISFYTNKKGEEPYYRRGLGLTLAWGDTPATYSLGDVDTAPDTNMVQYLKQVVSARYSYGKEFLVYGQMLPPPDINVPNFLIPAVSKIPYTMVEHPAFYSTSVLSSCWKSPFNSIGYVLTNISNQEVTFNLDISKYDLTGSNFDVYKILNGKYSLLYKNSILPKTEVINLKPNDVLLLKICPPLSGINDLSISDKEIITERDTLKLGEAINVKVTVHNTGNSDIYGTTVSLYDGIPSAGGKPMSLNQTIPLIKAGKSEPVEIIFRAEGLFKEQNLYVKVDSENLISETNENNNIARKAIFIEAPSILFDESHDEINTLTWNRALAINAEHPEWYYFGQFKNRIGQEYFMKSLVKGPITIDSLKNIQLLILAVPGKVFSESEIKAILNFIENGGRLLVMGNVSMPTAVNSLTEKFGVIYNGSPVVNKASIQDPGSFSITKFPSHAINSNLTNIFVNWCSSLEIQPPAEAFCYTDSSTWRDVNNNRVLDTNETKGPLVFGAISQHGKGVGVFLSDNAFHEGTFESNKIFMLNILGWLSNYKNTSTGINDNSYDLKTSFNLGQNYPNPFSSNTTISFNVPYHSQVTISIYNILGQRISGLLDEKKEQGLYTINWDGLDEKGQPLNSGIYFIEMVADRYRFIKKTVLLK